jgi:formamidopyrimidine-DNA glycosylase
MPELPEVETTRRLIHPDIVGRVITTVIVERPDRMLRRQEQPADFAARLVGRRIEGTARHGKRLLILLDDDLVWVIHLGMSGRMSIASDESDPPPHTHVRVRLDDGTEVRLTDPRTFGYTLVATQDELDELWAHGPDALTETPDVDALRSRLQGRTAPIKALLVDQAIIAGVGNIYADEALFAAGIDPHRPGGSLSGAEISALLEALGRVLAAGIDAGGTSLDDMAYLLPDGTAGEFAADLNVYGRQDEPCRRCGDPIRRDVIRTRSTFWSPGCQV